VVRVVGRVVHRLFRADRERGRHRCPADRGVRDIYADHFLFVVKVRLQRNIEVGFFFSIPRTRRYYSMDPYERSDLIGRDRRCDRRNSIYTDVAEDATCALDRIPAFVLHECRSAYTRFVFDAGLQHCHHASFDSYDLNEQPDDGAPRFITYEKSETGFATIVETY